MAAAADDSTLAPLGERLIRALRAEGNDLLLLLRDPAEEVLFAALRNPHLNEDHLLALLQRRELPTRLVEAIARLPQAGHRLRFALAGHPAAASTLLLTLLPQLYLFELIDLCFLPGASADLKLAAEREAIRRLPGTPLGNRITLARRATGAILNALLLDGTPQLVDACLDNPRLTEGVLHQFLRTFRAKAEAISLIARHPRWQGRPLLQQTILKNPHTPEVWFTLWLPRMASHQLKELTVGRIGAAQKMLVQQELKRRGM